MNTATTQTALNFKLNAFYDIDLGEINRQSFNEDEDFHVKEFFSRRGDLQLVVVSEKPFDATPYEEKKLKRLKKIDLMQECAKHDSALGATDSLTDIKSYYDHYSYTKADLIEQLLNVSIEEYYSSLNENTNWHDLEADFTVTGYVQGAVFKVVFLGEIPEFVNEKYLENIYFGTPFNVRIEDEHGDIIADLQEAIDSYTPYEKSVALSSFEELLKNYEYKDQAMLFLKDHLPTTLDYQ